MDSASMPNMDVFAQLIAPYLQNTQELAYIQVAVLALFIVNIIMTLEQEIERIWKAKQTKITLLYYLIRYVPPLSIGFGLWGSRSYGIKYWGNACKFWYWAEGLFGPLVAQTMADILMVVRVWALYLFSKRVLAFFGVLFAGRIALAIWAGVMQIAPIQLVPWPREAIPVPGCPPMYQSDYTPVQIACAYNMVTNAIIFLCLVNQCLARRPLDRPFLGTWRDLFGVRTAWPLMHTLLRDGNVYFLVILVAEMSLFILMSRKETYAVGLFFMPMMQAAYSIPATRLVLNLRERSYAKEKVRGGVHANEIVLEDISCIDFASRTSQFQTRDHSQTKDSQMA